MCLFTTLRPLSPGRVFMRELRAANHYGLSPRAVSLRQPWPLAPSHPTSTTFSFKELLFTADSPPRDLHPGRTRRATVLGTLSRDSLLIPWVIYSGASLLFVVVGALGEGGQKRQPSPVHSPSPQYTHTPDHSTEWRRPPCVGTYPLGGCRYAPAAPWLCLTARRVKPGPTPRHVLRTGPWPVGSADPSRLLASLQDVLSLHLRAERQAAALK